MDSSLRRTLPLSMLLLLAGCSVQPVQPPAPAPVVLPCPPPRISPELLEPAQTQAMDQLWNLLQGPSGSAAATPGASTP